MNSPALVLCMAGHYRRFREAGYTTPKFLLRVQGEPILTRIVRELAPERLALVANDRDLDHRDAIVNACVKAGCPEVDLHFVPDTSGQAATAALGARRALHLGWLGPLIFHNVDTILVGRDLSAIGAALAHADGWIDVFDHDSPAYSYVAVDGNRVTAIAEKVVISRHATTGMYGFRSASYYLDRVARTEHRSRGEFYISDVYRGMLADDARIVIEGVPQGATIVLGTPAEYEDWVAEHGA